MAGKNGYPIGKSQHGTIYGSYVEKEYAKKSGCNFLTQKIWNIAKNEMEKSKSSGALYSEYRFVCNLLTSQSLCFNLFGEFLERKDVLLKIFNEIKPNLMDKITEVKFEYSPGRGDEKYLGDHTAFDVFIEYEKNIFELYVEDFIKIMDKNIDEDWVKELFDRYIKGL
jgi:hypothetical protein